MSVIKIRRGNNADLPSGGSEEGEPRFSTDTGQLYIDDGTNNVEVTPNATNVAAAGAAMKSDVSATVIHGSTAGTARPTGYASVTWIGSVEPTNATTNDVWFDNS